MVFKAPSRLTIYLSLTAILLLAMWLRIATIDAQSLWIDEGFTWNLTQYSDVFAILQRDVHPPLYFLLMDAWVELAGTSVFAMRYFSLLPGVLSVAVVYRLAREITRQQGALVYIVPIIAALCMTVAEAETFLAQEARSYTWHVLLACLSMWSYLRWQRTAGYSDLGLWALSTVALVYTFYLGAFVGVTQGIHTLLFLRGKQRLIAVGTLVGCALALVPWLLWTGTSQLENVSRGEVILPEAYGFWFHEFLQQYLTGQWALILALMLAGLFAIQQKRWRVHPIGILLLLWVGVPLLLTLALNSFTPTYQPRRVSQIVPAIALLTGLGLGNLTQSSRLLRFVLVVVLVGYGVVSVDYTRYKIPWRSFVAQTAPLITPDTPMLFEIGGDDYAPRYHYHEALPNTHDFLLGTETSPASGANVLVGLTTWRHLQPDVYTGNLPAIISDNDHWWFFYWSGDDGALSWLGEFGFQRTASLQPDFNSDTINVYLYRYDRLPEMPLATYENGITLHHAIWHSDLRVELFWSTANALETDYTVSAFLLDEAGQVVAQQDSVPSVGSEIRPTSEWLAGEVIYDFKQMQPTSTSLAAGTYQLGITLYRRTLTDDGTESLDLLSTTEGATSVLPVTVVISE